MKVSIIIPLFNKEKYIRECLESVLNQLHKDIEIIVVDDGSTDGSAELVKEMQASCMNIALFCQVNSGPSSARNVGLKNVTGDYILFLDADDFLAENAIPSLISLFQEYDVDFIEFGSSQNTEVKSFDTVKEVVVGRNNLLKSLLKDGGIKSLVWGAIYKRKVLENCFFPENIILGEDSCFKLDVVLNSQTALIIDSNLYVNRILFDNTLSRRELTSELLDSIYLYICYYENKLSDISEIGSYLRTRLFIIAASYINNVYLSSKEDSLTKQLFLLDKVAYKYLIGTSIRKWKHILIYLLYKTNKTVYLFVISKIKK
ncbi:glycosyltransferase family 2 protein [Streptococcus sp. P25B114]